MLVSSAHRAVVASLVATGRGHRGSSDDPTSRAVTAVKTTLTPRGACPTDLLSALTLGSGRW